AAADPGDLVAVGRHRVEVAAEDHSSVTPELRACDHAGADGFDRERGRACAQPFFDDLRELGFLVALRRHADERSREPEEIGRVELEDLRLRHVAIPWSRRMSLSFALSWRSPSFRRRMISAHASE